MFIKINQSKNFKYVQLVRAYREDGQVKHEVLFNLGRLDQLQDNPEFAKVFKRLAEIAGAKSINIEACSEAQMTNWGYLVYKKLWEKFKLNHILPAVQEKQGKSQFNLNNACFLMTIQHLLSPTSKLGAHERQQRYTQFPDVELHHLYRALDILCESKESIELHLFQMNRDLFNMKVDVVFYDVTTFHFESVKKDSLKDFGFSKNAKFNEVQVVLGMLIDCEGRPVGYELFSGNTFEGKTLEVALEAIEKCFGIRNIVIVADRGINNKLNLKSIADKGYGYIVASRIKSMPEAVQAKILSPEDYITLSHHEEEGTVRYKCIEYVNSFKIPDQNKTENVKRRRRITVELSENLIVTYSDKRARKDKSDRERLLEKAAHLLEDKSKIRSSNKRNGKKYIKETTRTDWALDIAAIENDQKWDGYYGIQTSEKKLSVEEILAAHRTLYKIEESFSPYSAPNFR